MRGPATWLVCTIAAGLLIARLLVYAVLAGFAVGPSLCQWDCGWYLGIVQHGYDAAPHLVDGWWQANWAFFPLYPLLVRGLDALTGAVHWSERVGGNYSSDQSIRAKLEQDHRHWIQPLAIPTQ